MERKATTGMIVTDKEMTYIVAAARGDEDALRIDFVREVANACLTTTERDEDGEPTERPLDYDRDVDAYRARHSTECGCLAIDATERLLAQIDDYGGAGFGWEVDENGVADLSRDED